MQSYFYGLYIYIYIHTYIYSKIGFLQKHTLRITKTVSTAKINTSEMYKSYSSHPQRYIPAKYLKNVSMKTVFLGKDFIRSFFLFQMSSSVGCYVPRV